MASAVPGHLGGLLLSLCLGEISRRGKMYEYFCRGERSCSPDCLICCRSGSFRLQRTLDNIHHEIILQQDIRLHEK